MTNADDTPPTRITVRIPTVSGDNVEAWLYLPEGPGPHPAVVMAHGIGAIKAGGLAPFAERFCREGFAAVVFDYRQWGGSAGQPREELSDPRQRDDYRTALTWAAMRPDIDASQLFAWGTSFAGMYIVELAVSEPRLAGVIGQSPLVDGFAAARLGSPMRQLRLLAVTLQDRSAQPCASLNEPPAANSIARAGATTTSTREARASRRRCASSSSSSTGTRSCRRREARAATHGSVPK
jgi:predicted acyl esterase